MPNDDRMLTTEEAAAFLGIGKRTLDNWRWRGCGPEFHKYGGAVRYLEGTLRAWRAAAVRTNTGGGRPRDAAA